MKLEGAAAASKILVFQPASGIVFFHLRSESSSPAFPVGCLLLPISVLPKFGNDLCHLCCFFFHILAARGTSAATALSFVENSESLSE